MNPTPWRLGFRPELDGLRGIAVTAVILYHWRPASMQIMRGGFIGVDLFFVLSGFLITSILLQEYVETGEISLRAFYGRRALRLLPALSLVLIAVFAVSLLLALISTHLTPTKSEWAVAQSVQARSALPFVILYVGNWARAFHMADLGSLSHTWSLAIEEQYYLVWPVVLVVLLRRKISFTGLFALASTVVILCAVWRGFLSLHGATASRVYNGTDTRIDALMVGSCLAIALTAFKVSTHVDRIFRWMFWPATVGLISYSLFGGPWTQNIGFYFNYSLVAAGGLLVIGGLVVVPSQAALRVLTTRSMTWIGRLSYGFYLWHYVIIYFLGEHWLLDIPFTIVAVTASYYLVEKKCLRAKKRLSRRSDREPNLVTAG